MLKSLNISKILAVWRENWLLASLLIICLISIYGAGVYFLYNLSWLAIIIILTLSFLSFFWLSIFIHTVKSDSEGISNIKEEKNYLKYWPIIAYLVLLVITLAILLSSRTDRPIISPWQVVPGKFFIFYFLSTLSLVLVLLKKQINKNLKILSLSSYYFLSFGIAVLVYKIAYGFDPFIHQATMEFIDKYGPAEPKSLYYLGQYSLIIIIHKLSAIPIDLLNKFLVPVLASIFIPWAIMKLSSSQTNKSLPVTQNRYQYLSGLLILIIGFSPFIMTTPQSLSYLFLILAILIGLVEKRLLWPIALSLSALAVHPLTGLPALGWLGFLIVQKYKSKLKIYLYRLLNIVLFFSNALILPSALFISGENRLNELTVDLAFFLAPWKNLIAKFSLAGTENIWLNTAYFIQANYFLWILILILTGIYVYRKTNPEPFYKSLFLISASLLLAYLLTGLISFNNVIGYEQGEFAGRILILIILFLLPFILLAFNKFLDLIAHKEAYAKLIWLIGGALLLSTSLYLSYPRFDNYFNSRGYSTGVNDIKAVKLISEIAENPYIVLANQQVSAAALKELGFNNYYPSSRGPIFFYPIPTGGPMYQYYLDMVYKNPDQKTMAEARNLVGVEESYFVINKYWHQSAKIIQEAKLSAQSWQSVNDEVYIFKYSSEK